MGGQRVKECAHTLQNKGAATLRSSDSNRKTTTAIPVDGRCNSLQAYKSFRARGFARARCLRSRAIHTFASHHHLHRAHKVVHHKCISLTLSGTYISKETMEIGDNQSMEIDTNIGHDDHQPMEVDEPAMPSTIGIHIRSWDTDRALLMQKTLTCKLAKDLPHSIPDLMNRFTFPAATHVLMMEATIFEKTVQSGDPEAPRIHIVNPDAKTDSEAVPLWEFSYTDEMWHSQGVPAPKRNGRTGCSCKGACNPAETSDCACIIQQACSVGKNTFVYNNQGKLKFDQPYEIWECNELCDCDETCRNRVSQPRTQSVSWTNGRLLGHSKGTKNRSEHPKRRSHRLGCVHPLILIFHH